LNAAWETGRETMGGGWKRHVVSCSAKLKREKLQRECTEPVSAGLLEKNNNLLLRGVGYILVIKPAGRETIEARTGERVKKKH